MIPGSVSKLTETTQVVQPGGIIYAKSDIVRVSGVGPIATIVPGLGTQQGQFLVLVPDAALVLVNTGNIAVGITCAADRPVFMVFVKSLGKWLINSGV